MPRRPRPAPRAVVILVGAVLLGACATAVGPTRATSPGSQGRSGGTLTLVGNGDVDSLDTAIGYDGATFTLMRAYTRQLYAFPTASTVAKEEAPVPDLATAMPTVSKNHTVYTVTIRSGAMWNTTPPRQVSAADVVLGFKRLCSPARPAGMPGYYQDTVVGMQRFCAGFASAGSDPASIRAYVGAHDISGIEAIDRRTVRFTLIQPAADFVDLLALPFASPAPEEYLAYVPGSAGQAAHVLSDGPYAVTGYVPGRSIVLGRNRAWQSSSDPLRRAYVASIEVREGVANPEDALAQVRSASADLLWDQQVPTAELPVLETTHDPRLVVGPDADSALMVRPFLSVNLQSPNDQSALKKLPVREALAFSIDKAADAAILGGPAVAAPLDQLVPDGSAGHVAGLDPYPTSGDRGDPQKARELLASAGYRPGQVTLRLVYQTSGVHLALAKSDQQALEQAGFNVQLVPVASANAFYSSYLDDPAAARAGAWDVAEVGWLPDWLGDNGRSFLAPLVDGRTYGTRTQDYGDYDRPAVDAAIDKALAATSQQQAATSWQAAARQALADAAIVPIAAEKVAVYHSSRVHDCDLNAFNANCDVTNVWLGP